MLMLVPDQIHGCSTVSAPRCNGTVAFGTTEKYQIFRRGLGSRDRRVCAPPPLFQCDRTSLQKRSQQLRRTQSRKRCTTAAASFTAFAQPEVIIPHSADERLVLLERLQRNTLQTGTKEGLNVVAFGGGAASTLAAYLAHAVFEGKCVAVFVRLPGTSEEDVVRVKYLAAFIGIDLWQLPAASPPMEGHGGDEVEDDVPAGALPAVLAAIREMLRASGGPPSVVFDGLHAEDLPNFSTQKEDVFGSWEGSEDSGEAAAASYASVSEAEDRDVDLSLASPLPSLPAARRVSLLAGLPEIAVRAVADLAGMPNWDWVKPEVVPAEEGASFPHSPNGAFHSSATASSPSAFNSDQHTRATTQPQAVSDSALLSKAHDAVQEVLQLDSPHQIHIQAGQTAEAEVCIDPDVLPSPSTSIMKRLSKRLQRLGLRPILLQPSSPS